MAESKFKIFLEKYYNSSFDTKRSGKNNVITRVNSCVVNNINTVIEPQIKDFELSMPQECYTTLSENPTTDQIQNCISKYGQFDYNILKKIQRCLGTSQQNCTTSVSFQVDSEGDVEYISCCGFENFTSFGLGKQNINDCIQVGSLKPSNQKGKPATINEISYPLDSCDCSQDFTPK
jgi:hypothetical protein